MTIDHRCLLIAVGIAGAPFAVPAQTVQRRDSAGITIVTSPPGVADRPSGWTIDTAPDLQIGVSAGDPRYEFSRIAGIAPLPDGIVVVDAASCEIRFFDSRGVFVRRVGRRGNGPGEFRQPRLVPSLRYDSLLIADNSTARLTTIRLDGALGATVLTSGRLLALGQIAPSRIVAISLLPVTASDAPAINHYHRVIRVVSVPGGQTDTVAAFPFLIISGPTASPGEYVSDFPPFTAPGIAAAGRSAVFAANGVDAEIRRYDATGRLMALYRLGKTVIPVSPRQFSDSLERQWRRSAGAALGRLADELPVPRAQPPWDGLTVDALGNVWAESHDGVFRNAVEWTIVSSDGVAIGTASTPANLDVGYIGADFVLGVWRDADGVEFVRRYRLRKR